MLTPRRSAQLGLAASALMLVSSIGVLAVRANHQPNLSQVHVAASFSLQDTDGKEVSLDSLRGQVVVLLFTSTRCPVSTQYSRRIAALGKRYAGSSEVEILAVNSNVGSGEVFSVGEIRRQAVATGQPFPTLLDTTGRVAREYGVTMTPTVVVIDARGIIRYRGAFDDNPNQTQVRSRYCEDALSSVLLHQSPATASTQAFGCRID